MSRRVAVATGLLLGALVLLYGLRPLAGWDIWWHLRTGGEALATGSTLPIDPFSHTFGGQPWRHKDLGADILLWAAHALGGPLGLLLLRALLFLAAIALVSRQGLRRGAAPAIMVVLAGLVTLSTEFRFVLRPALFSLVLLPVLLSVRQRLFDRDGWAYPLAVAALFACWANLHRGALLGLGVPAIDLGLAVLTGRRRRVALGAMVAAGVAVLLTPSGVGIFGMTAGVVAEAGYRESISEWATPTPSLLLRQFPWLLLTDIAIIGGVLLGWWRGRRTEDPTGAPGLFDLLLLGYLAACGAAGVRFLAYLPLGLAGAAAAGWTVLLGSRRAGRLGGHPRLALLLAVLLLAVGIGRYPYKVGLGWEERRYPDAALAFVTSEGVEGKVLNSLIFGGHLIWNEVPVFLDGRNDQVYPVPFLLKTLAAGRDPALFRELAAAHGVEWLLIADEVGDAGWGHLAGAPDWVPVHWTDVAVVYVRAEGPNGALARRRGYRWLAPAAPIPSLGGSLAAAGGDKAKLVAIQAEVDRAAFDDPGSVRAASLRVLLLHALGDPELPAAVDELVRLGAGQAAVDEVLRRVGVDPG